MRLQRIADAVEEELLYAKSERDYQAIKLAVKNELAKVENAEYRLKQEKFKYLRGLK